MEINDNSPELPGMTGPEITKKNKKTLADLRKEITEKLPVESMVPPVSTNPSDLAAVGDYYEKHTGLKRATLPPKDIVIGDRIMDAAKIHEVRTGKSHRGYPAIGILYEYADDIGTKFIEAELPEGIDPMPMAKAIKWGVAPELDKVIVRDYPAGGFLTMAPFNPADLVDRPVLEAHKAAAKEEIKGAYGSTIASQAAKIGSLTEEVKTANNARAAAEAWAKEYKSESQLIRWLKWLIAILILIWVIWDLVRH